MLFQPDVVLLSFVKFNPHTIWVREKMTPISKKKK